MAPATLHISICIGSEVFSRGLHDLLLEQRSRPVQVSRDPPGELIKRLTQGRSRIDLLILDRACSDKLAPHLKRAHPGPRLLLVSEQRHAGARSCELLDQACGFFPARADEDKLRELLQFIVDCPSPAPGQKLCERCPLARIRAPCGLPLTERECEVFASIGQLHGPSEIAARLGVSPKTIEAHCANIKHKLNLTDSKQLLKAAIDWVEGR